MNYDRFLSFYNKKNYDMERPDIDLYNFHPQLRVIFALTGVFFDGKISIKRFMWPCLSILELLISLFFEMMFVVHFWYERNYQSFTECLCYIVIIGYGLSIHYCLLTKRKEIVILLSDMNIEFRYICTLDPTYKGCFLKGQLFIWKLFCVWSLFCLFVLVSLVTLMVLALVYHSLFATLDEHSVRPLIFPVWLPNDDPYRTPNYESFFGAEVIIVLFLVILFGVYNYALFHLLLHKYILMDVIILMLAELFDDVDPSVAGLPKSSSRRRYTQEVLNAKIKQIIQWHATVFDLVKRVSSIFGLILVYQVVFTSFGICLIAYQFAEQLQQGEINVVFLIFGIQILVQIYIPCYIGTMFRNRSFSVADACWASDWPRGVGMMLRQDLLLIIMRAQKPLTIEFTGLPPVQLETFFSIVSASYSYFNMLRQSTRKTT